jgi:hypothetical protein
MPNWFRFWKKEAKEFQEQKKEEDKVIIVETPKTPEPEQEAQIFTVRGELAILDDRQLSYNRSYRKGAKLEVLNPVPVHCGQKLIGGANIFIQNDILMCDMFLDYNIPERLDYENGTKDSWPHFQGFCKVEDTVDFPRITAYCINSIEIRKQKNQDPRIPPI